MKSAADRALAELLANPVDHVVFEAIDGADEACDGGCRVTVSCGGVEVGAVDFPSWAIAATRFTALTGGTRR